MKIIVLSQTKRKLDFLFVDEQNQLECRTNWVKIRANLKKEVLWFLHFQKVEFFV